MLLGKSRLLSPSILTSFAAVATLLGCNFQDIKTAAPSPNATKTSGTSDYQWLQSNLFTPSCVSCHNSGKAQGGVNLETAAALLSGKGKKGEALVVAKSSAQSLVYTVISSGYMPTNGTVDAAVLAALAKWIDNGADPDSSLLTDSGDSTRQPTAVPTATRPVPTAVPRPTPTSERTIIPGETPSPTPAVSFSEVSAQIFTPYCLNCHDSIIAMDGVDLSTYSMVMHNPRGIVVPGEPMDSSLFLSVREGGTMPQGGPPLPAELIDLLSRWIEGGAQP